ncbi:MAG TPA: HAD-IIIA family hydrolase [Thermoanaerobaculia bacterium]
MKRALFIDRDGVLDHLVHYPSSDEWESPRTVADLKLVEGVTDALEQIAAAGWLLVIITNQPSHAKGKVSRESLLEVHEALVASLPVTIHASYVCFHHPEGVVPELSIRCDCRKPGTRFLREAALEFDIDLAASWMVGDQDSDLLCGRAAGCRVALIPHPGSEHKRGEVEPDVRCRDLNELAAILMES